MRSSSSLKFLGKPVRILLAGSGVCLIAGAAQAQVQIGAGTGIPHEVVDTAANGPRTNVDQGSMQTLGPGAFTATEFSFAAGQEGDAIPFLAISNGTNSYEVIAVGDLVTIAGPFPQVQTVPFGGSGAFTLTAPTVVFAGVTNSANSPQNPIFLDNNTGPNTDHDNAGLDPVFLGATVSSFSHPDLPRTYAFSITVVPEPAAAGLIGLAGLGLLRRRRA